MILIQVKHLTANIPFRQCNIRFKLKSHDSNHPNTQKSEVALLPKPVSIDIQQTIKVKQSQLTGGDDLMLCVIVVSLQKSKQSVVHIGYILVDPFQPLEDRRAPLRGLPDQTGYIIYSVIHIQKDIQKKHTDIITDRKVQIEDYVQPQPKQQQPPRISQVKRNKNSIVNVNNLKIISQGQLPSKNYTQPEYKGDPSTIPTLKAELDHIREQTQLYKKQITKRIDTYEQTIEILRHQLINQQYVTALRQNEIFQLQNKAKIDRLVGNALASAEQIL